LAKVEYYSILVLQKLIGFYRYFISPLWGNCCRFYPSCSKYAEEALIEHGVVQGSWLTMKRLGRCHPWHRGGVDPVPKRNED